MGGDINIIQAFSDKNINNEEDYCNNWVMRHESPIPKCQVDMAGQNLNCSEIEDIESLGCHFSSVFDKYSSVTIQFPKDFESIEIDDFGEGESADFFKEFNGAEPQFNQMRKSLTFYAPKFDLSKLSLHTNASITKEVIVKADTVYMTEPLDVTYQLSIIARVVSIDKLLTMTLRSEKFNLPKMRTKYEKNVAFNNLVKRHRNFGLIEIVDVVPLQSASTKCKN